MLANVATHINTSKMTLGLEPAALRIRDAVMTSNRVFERTAAIVKPPIRSMIVGENIWEKMYLDVSFFHDREFDTYLVASAAVNRVSFPSDDRRARSRTTRNGTASEVTNSGMAYMSAFSHCLVSFDPPRWPRGWYKIPTWPNNCSPPLDRKAAPVQ